MVRWLRWHCPPDTGFEIRALAVWGRARYLSITEAPHNTDFHTWMGKKHFCFFETAETGNRTPNSGVKGSGANHYPRAPAHVLWRWSLVIVNLLVYRLACGCQRLPCEWQINKIKLAFSQMRSGYLPRELFIHFLIVWDPGPKVYAPDMVFAHRFCWHFFLLVCSKLRSKFGLKSKIKRHTIW